MQNCPYVQSACLVVVRGSQGGRRAGRAAGPVISMAHNALVAGARVSHWHGAASPGRPPGPCLELRCCAVVLLAPGFR